MLDGTIQDYEVNVNGTKLFVKIEIVMAGVLRSIYYISYKLRPDLDHANLE
jgi:hypothetical protein